jgi:PAS domain S-box-containing protein
MKELRFYNMITPDPWAWISAGLVVAMALSAAFVAGYRVRSRWSAAGNGDLFEQIQDAALVTENGAVIDANQAALDQFGYSRKNLIGLPVASLLADPADERDFVQALTDGPVRDFELRLKRSDGQVRDCLITANARFDLQGNVIGCRGLARDVTDRHRAVTALRHAEQDYRGLFENAHDAILILDRLDETALDVNHRACVLYKFSREELVGRSMAELSVNPDRGRSLLRRTRDGQGRYFSFESRQRRGDGVVVDVEMNAAEVSYKGRQVILSINRDISGRRTAEKAVRDSEERFRLLLESVTDCAIVMLDPTGRIASWNEGAQRMTGYVQDEVLGRSVGIFTPSLEREWLLEDLAAAVAKGRAERNTQCLRKDGGTFEAAQTLTRIVDESGSLRGFASVTRDVTERVQLEKTRQELVTALSDVATEWTTTFDAVQLPIVLLDAEGEIRRLNRAAQTLANRPFTGIINAPASEIGGEPWGSISRLARETFQTGLPTSVRVRKGEAVWHVSSCLVGSESTGRRAIVAAYDLSLVTQLEASLRNHEISAAMGSMVAAVAHEVRNPLFTISAIIDAWGARYSGESEALARYGGPLREQVDRLTRLMTDLLDYGRPHTMNVLPAAIEDAIRGAARDCAVTADRVGARVLLDIEPGLPSTAIDPRRMEQVFQNVIDNGLRHSPAEATVRVEARLEEDHFICRVTDEGPGIAVEDLERSFTPFFTRRPGGTGLGLSIARRIVNDHGGEISLANREDRPGAIVTILLPLTREASIPALESQAEAC